jgi:Raf kinase inhibitor-like YbhB/YbcL family protein
MGDERFMNQPLSFSLSSPGFLKGGIIPTKHSCDGENVSPILAWAYTPSGTQSLALILEDPDAPAGNWTHWTFYNMSPILTRLPEHISPMEYVGGIGTQGLNSWSKIGYGGPCPPHGKAHRYFFLLYALDLLPNLPPHLTSVQLQGKMNGHILERAEYWGIYQR